jgi:hypothetical protein
MITVDVPPHGIVALEEDDERLRYDVVDCLSTSRPAGGQGPQGQRVRALVEVQRRFGGMAPRAVVGGEFVVGDGTETVFEVLVGADYDALVAEGREAGSGVTLPGRIHSTWPLIAGLPAEFAESTLRGLVDNLCAGRLPAGVLRLDRAAFDEVESANPVFAQAGAALCCALAAKLQGADPADELRALIETW